MREEISLALSDASLIVSSESKLIDCIRFHAPNSFEQLEAPPAPRQLGEYYDEHELPSPQELMSTDDCSTLSRELLRLNSARSALNFALFELLQELRQEAIRLAGLVALCRHFEPELAEEVYDKVLDNMLRKYVGV